MRDVSIIGIGQTKVGEHWERSLSDLAVEAALSALDNAGLDTADVLYVGNMLGGMLSGQEHLGALIADMAGLRGLPALRVEAADASGAVALHEAYQVVAGGAANIALAIGVEKMTDRLPDAAEAGLAAGGLGDYEAAQGITAMAQSAMLMQRYLHEYGLEVGDFAAFPVNAHRNAAANPFAMYRNQVSEKAYRQAKMVATPINLLDGAPLADGAAAVVLVATDHARALGRPGIRILASTLATDSIALTDRDDVLSLGAARRSAEEAYTCAGLGPGAVNVAELHDAYSILAALSLEACGFAARGQGVRLGLAGDIGREGCIPIATLGGFKARGNPVGASGLYQAVEIITQLRGEAGASQIPGARVGLAQNLGGNGATAVTHIFSVN